MTRPTLPAFASTPLLRRAAMLAGISFLLALALVGYLFGVQDHFFGRLFSAFFVFFWLLAVTFLGVVPFVNWAAANWFGQEWAEAPTEPTRRPRPNPKAATTRKPTRTATRLNSTQHP
ncbi:hypothetical protein MUN84_08290 [Hymenobacter sp. 5516J-16]|uniref:Uncharacterized protein n=1 Tax=Hymenobacter sublimis TaxID=2933777 RepID=A0ABY4J9L3_9BACT|nr:MULTISPECIES: hypothetical protein [Hymenobacter]UOQ78538.1 hypothetical protein MUN84_08290 [Hymenobacter sp. 5516J-16]UPL48514.1 hypothetical protein MWH26_15130 [Hymenobacter sublimis]